MAIFDPLLHKCRSLTHIKQLQAHLITVGLSPFCPFHTKLLEFCSVSPAGNIDYAAEIFRQIGTPATNDWNAIIRGLAQSKTPQKAITWYRTMSRWPRKPDALTCSFALKACARVLALLEAKQIHSQLLRFGFQADVLLITTLLDVYAKAGDLDCAEQLFDEMGLRDVATWNALIAGLAQGSRPRDALALFSRMRLEGFKPNEVTVLGALSACSQLGALREGEIVHAYVREEGLDKNVQVCNVVIDMYAKCGFVDKAYNVFDTMCCTRSLVSWNTMIMALAMHGRGAQALELFGQMGRTGVHPDAITYLAALSACNHGGLVSHGVELFNSMVRSGVTLNVKHYGSVVDLLGRAGRLEEAYLIITSMPMIPDVVLWQSLLGACKTYGNVEMAERASRALVEMGSNSCGDFVLLSNVYAAHERWDDVGRVREAMRNRDVKKVPGFSFIEVEGVIHKFLNGDQSHSNWREIYSKIDEIGFKINAHGYVPETCFVLHDIGEEDKEYALCYHSEKLAIAFGLISTSEGSPIQVIKNLRICGDCHVVIKLISKIYDREIIMAQSRGMTEGVICKLLAWDAIHVIEMSMDLSVAEGHLCNMGMMIEEMESKLRNSLDQFSYRDLTWATQSWLLQYTCPDAEAIVRSVVREALLSDSNMAAVMLRLHFHDCFVQGCDGSILIDNGPTAEKQAIGHQGVGGFEVIEKAKTQLEAVCQGVVSCADISNGPVYRVPTGRRDGQVSNVSLADDMPEVSDSIQQLKAKFMQKGLSEKDLVLLSAAHTIGTMACFFMTRRLYNIFPGTGGADPSINPKFLIELKAKCPRNGDVNVRLPMNHGSGEIFDVQILRNIKDGFAVLESDARLYNNKVTKSVIDSYLGLQSSKSGPFFELDFAKVMVKMGQIGVMTGSLGEIRRVCRALN
ncbi:hypothetical protein HHK36_030488 [Tetracentron sinense]|uniref:peroxidase n=1 Tax=Tetracentron sinense TaxID=13715 RepID=A0A834YCL5_TETSI|nr:hypothetical protein HHK36_030488 [Tetracentron sinense]